MQLDLFGMPMAPEPAAAVLAVPVNDWWLADVEDRRAGVLRSAEFWQRTHDDSGLQYSQESIYAAELRALAADMEADPEYHRRKPKTVTDVQWFRAKGGAL
jgi:hypothetical protein